MPDPTSKTLRVRAGEQDHLYESGPKAGGGAGILASEHKVSREATEEEIKSGDLDLRIAAPFLGAQDKYGLPQGEAADGEGWRAKLEAGGRLVIDGLIYKDDCEFDVLPESFSLRVVTAAQEGLWQALEEVDLISLSDEARAALAYKEGPLAVPRTANVNDNSHYLRTEGWRFYELGQLVTVVLEEAGAVLNGALPPFRVKRRYLASGGEETWTFEPDLHVISWGGYDSTPKLDANYNGGDVTLPDWTGKQLLEECTRAFGWRLSATFDPYPSETIRVRIVGDRFSETPGLPTIADRVGEGGYTQLTRGDPSALAIRISKEIRRGSLKPPKPGGAFAGDDVAAPPVVAQLATQDWRFDEDDNLDVENSVETGFRLPQVRVNAVSDYTPAGAPAGYSETIYAGPMGYNKRKREAAFLVSMADIDFFGVGQTEPLPVWGRKANGALPKGARRYYGGAWASSLYEQRVLSRVTRDAIDGPFNVQGIAGDIDVGLPEAGLSLEGVPWVVASLDHKIDSDETSLQLERPQDGVKPPDTDWPGKNGPAQVLDVRLYERPVSGYSVVASWKPPLGAKASAVAYRVTIFNKDNGNQLSQRETLACKVRLLTNSAQPSITYRIKVEALDEEDTASEPTSVTLESSN